jgi:hypothetical protein
LDCWVLSNYGVKISAIMLQTCASIDAHRMLMRKELVATNFKSPLPTPVAHANDRGRPEQSFEFVYWSVLMAFS